MPEVPVPGMLLGQGCQMRVHPRTKHPSRPARVTDRAVPAQGVTRPSGKYLQRKSRPGLGTGAALSFVLAGMTEYANA